ncbi:hypothetical protein [Thauera sp.]|jgi:hypothetical protein|uniref:hypothetical protein n=1 Tax=Thauera sp. TaxID=1905334 RepID=UPI002A35FE52|nr:hypothetical protein [Thauera sp.]MDX9884191.1 hypothetical protein [Thauera sp.]
MKKELSLRMSLAATAFSVVLGGGAGFAHAQGSVWLSGPSVATLGAKANFSGGNLPPGAVVRVLVQEAGAASHQSDVLVAPDGTLSYELNPSLEGEHSVTVLDPGGQTLATARLNVMR